jgi:hypothetical protein
MTKVIYEHDKSHVSRETLYISLLPDAHILALLGSNHNSSNLLGNRSLNDTH